ncbi:MAG: thioredoxin family protein [Pirellulales bacterium]
MLDYAAKFAAGLSYADFLTAHGTDEHARKWHDWHGRVTLTDAQRETLTGFRRKMPVVCFAGAWCGDCVQQCPIFDRFAAVSPLLDVRYFDRDAHPDLGAELKLCGARGCRSWCF